MCCHSWENNRGSAVEIYPLFPVGKPRRVTDDGVGELRAGFAYKDIDRPQASSIRIMRLSADQFARKRMLHAQRLIQIPENIFNILQADGQTNEIRADACRHLFFL